MPEPRCVRRRQAGVAIASAAALVAGGLILSCSRGGGGEWAGPLPVAEAGADEESAAANSPGVRAKQVSEAFEFGADCGALIRLVDRGGAWLEGFVISKDEDEEKTAAEDVEAGADGEHSQSSVARCELRREQPLGVLTFTVDCATRYEEEELRSLKEQLLSGQHTELPALGRMAVQSLPSPSMRQVQAFDDQTPCALILTWMGEGADEAPAVAGALLRAIKGVDPQEEARE
jgi:hypothetical protein